MITKQCKICGKMFQTCSDRKQYCNDVHYSTCPICGNQFILPNHRLHEIGKITCSKECASKQRSISMKKTVKNLPEGWNRCNGSTKNKKIQPLQHSRRCAGCGDKFIPSSSTQKYCRKEKISHCIVCGKPRSYICGEFIPQMCDNNECYIAGMKMINLKKHGVSNPAKLTSSKENAKKTNQQKYGTDWYTQTEEYKERAKQTCLHKYGVEHHLQSQEVIDRRIETVQTKYGVSNVFKSSEIQQKSHETMKAKFGFAYPSQVPSIRKKAIKNSRISKLEQRIADLFFNYNLEFIQHHTLTNEEEQISHEFDFYLPKYKIFIDADGLYFHGYLDDPDGHHVLDYYDDIRISLVPKDHEFYVIVEGNEDKAVKEIVRIIEEKDCNVFNYDSYLFQWCRSIAFPYPVMEISRMISDWTHLCQYENVNYVPTCRLGESIIRNYHRSIYSAHVGNSPSPIDAWYDDDLLKKVIKNRLIYVNNVDPSKILRGLNISKLCPIVSIFNPVLTKYLIKKYLDEFHEVFDPFSGFSGRLLGAVACSKSYIGQDINKTAVDESQQIIEFLKLSEKATVNNADIFVSEGSYPCLLTCPPYGHKETYSNETIYKNCDEWITECLNRFNCRRYVFVIDETEKYAQYIRETLKSTSHFSNVTEQVVVIDR